MDSMCLRFWRSKWEGMEWGKGEQEFRARVDGLSQVAKGSQLTSAANGRVIEELRHGVVGLRRLPRRIPQGIRLS
jgi:hypothetical protein